MHTTITNLDTGCAKHTNTHVHLPAPEGTTASEHRASSTSVAGLRVIAAGRALVEVSVKVAELARSVEQTLTLVPDEVPSRALAAKATVGSGTIWTMALTLWATSLQPVRLETSSIVKEEAVKIWPHLVEGEQVAVTVVRLVPGATAPEQVEKKD